MYPTIPGKATTGELDERQRSFSSGFPVLLPKEDLRSCGERQRIDSDIRSLFFGGGGLALNPSLGHNQPTLRRPVRDHGHVARLLTDPHRSTMRQTYIQQIPPSLLVIRPTNTRACLHVDVGVISGAIKYIQADFDLSTLQKASKLRFRAAQRCVWFGKAVVGSFVKGYGVAASRGKPAAEADPPTPVLRSARPPVAVDCEDIYVGSIM